MCGIAGYLSNKDFGSLVVEEMVNELKHRGPNDNGVWLDNNAGIALGHRRLSIQDVSSSGHQPMLSPSGRYVVSYNGEIYNFLALKKELENLNYNFHGYSDTEILITAIEAWGLEKSLDKFVGMFAFALWDRKVRRLTLARDRMGEKPLYYGWQGQSLLFGSELKALRRHPDWQGEIDRNSITLQMRYSYIPEPFSIYKGIHKLKSGTFVHFPVGNKGIMTGVMPIPTNFWTVKNIAEIGVSNPFVYNDEQAVIALEKLLSESIRDKMISDVPLGAFLSGGIDSSVVVALMQAHSNKSIKTFTIGFCEQSYNEAKQAHKVAKHIGTDHTELYVTSKEARDVIPMLPTLYDEPFSDSSQIPTFIISEMTKKHVSVAISGDGGDELFAGYNRHFLGPSIWEKLSFLSVELRGLMARGITAVSPEIWDRVGKVLGKVVPQLRYQTGDKLHKLAAVLTVRSQEEMYLNYVSHWGEPELLVIGGREPLTAITDPSRWSKLGKFSQNMLYWDSISYLPGDILTKVDRASMGVGLEIRIPLLDHRIFEFAWRLPLHQKVRNGEGKWLLRQLLYKYVPKQMIDRPKMGFGVPLDKWLRGPLREWTESLLSENRLRQEGFFNYILVRKKLEEHISGKRNWQYHLWDVLMFQAWLETQ
jgi:asparagine synthase (glutamine-hydrolysing)